MFYIAILFFVHTYRRYGHCWTRSLSTMDFGNGTGVAGVVASRDRCLWGVEGGVERWLTDRNR